MDVLQWLTATTQTQYLPRKRAHQKLAADRPSHDPNVRLFLDYFQEIYADKRHGAKYLVIWERDSTVVKRLLKVATLDELKIYARILLSDKTEYQFIVDSDRGIGVLAIRFNWLADRYATWKAQHAST